MPLFLVWIRGVLRRRRSDDCQYGHLEPVASSEEGQKLQMLTAGLPGQGTEFANDI